jgi:hypothetical protein
LGHGGVHVGLQLRQLRHGLLHQRVLHGRHAPRSLHAQPSLVCDLFQALQLSQVAFVVLVRQSPVLGGLVFIVGLSLFYTSV